MCERKAMKDGKTCYLCPRRCFCATNFGRVLAGLSRVGLYKVEPDKSNDFQGNLFCTIAVP